MDDFLKEYRDENNVLQQNFDMLRKDFNSLRSAFEQLGMENGSLHTKLDSLQTTVDGVVADNLRLKDILESRNESAIEALQRPRDHDNMSSTDFFGEADDVASYSKAVKGGPKHKSYSPQYSLPVHNRFELLTVMKEMAMLDEKAHNAVIVGYPERTDRGKATANHDDQEISGFLRRAKIDMNDVVEIRRHGQLTENRNRPIKIFTKSKDTRDAIIRAFRLCKPTDSPPGSYCRRDLTPTELAEDRRLRSEAYRLNEKEGRRIWTVRDLRLMQLKGPNYETFAKDWKENRMTASLVET
jgi:hypothetical protein